MVVQLVAKSWFGGPKWLRPGAIWWRREAANFIPRRGLRPEIPVLPARSRNAAAVIDTGKTGKIILPE
jgi:hypothetical protein